MSHILNLSLFLFIIYINACSSNEFCEIKGDSCNTKQYRYLFYDVNPPEGFNLRRDVYMRFAVFAHNLQRSTMPNISNFKLVLPPWTNLHHWHRGTSQIPWSHFFNLDSLKKFAPVIEMHDFFNEINVKYSKINIEEVYVLQHFKEMFETGKFEDKLQIDACSKQPKMAFYYYNNITSNNIKCLSFHGYTSDLKMILEATNAQTILFDHAEVALHDKFGSKIYWQARRSMRFNNELKQVAADFRKNYLNSSDLVDGTSLPEDWRNEKGKRTAKGGPYLSVHLRRQDFALGRPNDVPSIEKAVLEISKYLKKLNLNVVFIATDASKKEYDMLETLLSDYKVYRFPARKTLSDGALAIIDQIICSHAQFFIGTHESTFTFRIQEEREIMGFSEETTFNRLCGKTCDKPSIWRIVY